MMIKKFNEIERIALAPLDTPVEPMNRLSRALPGAPNLYIKRDDFIGPLVWGNKLRKLEYSFAKARQEGADVIITCGGIQSNHARTTSMVARRLGLDSVLVLNGEPPAIPTRNYRISLMMASEIVVVADKNEREPKMKEIAAELAAKGKKPFIIPLGASDVNGTPGFVRAMSELILQQENLGLRFSHIVVSSSSGGTQGGLEAGKRIAAMHDIKIIGISADEKKNDLCNNVLQAANSIMQLVGGNRIECQDLNIDDRFTGKAYGVATPESERAADLFLEHEGILLDHTYTAKAAAGLIAMIEENSFETNSNVLFWHTGGLINLF